MAKARPRTKNADSMVPIYSPNLRAAIADQHVTVAELARKVKTNPQTIAYLAAGDDVKRSRASRRAQIAKILRVDEEFLSASGQVQPWMMAGVNVMGFGTVTSPRTQLALGRLIEKCVEATDRDLVDRALKDAGIKEGASPDDVRQHVAYCLRKLTDVDDQRAEQLVGAEHPALGILFSGGMIRSRHLPVDRDEEEAGLGLIAAWEQILEPWFSKHAKLNYRRLRERAGFPVPDGERRSDTNPHIIVWQPLKGAS